MATGQSLRIIVYRKLIAAVKMIAFPDMHSSLAFKRVTCMQALEVANLDLCLSLPLSFHIWTEILFKGNSSYFRSPKEDLPGVNP